MIVLKKKGRGNLGGKREIVPRNRSNPFRGCGEKYTSKADSDESSIIKERGGKRLKLQRIKGFASIITRAIIAKKKFKLGCLFK